MDIKDSLIALAVIVIWGVNFYFMRLALWEVSPMVLGMLRFAGVFMPAVLFVKRPKVRWWWLLAYGLTISFGHFGFMFTALAAGMPTGLAALLLQSQVFFTVMMAALLLKEQVRANHVLAIGLASIGLVLIGVGQFRGALPMLGVVWVLCAALSWALGNIVLKRIGKVNALSLVVWGNGFALVAFTLVALWQHGGAGVGQQVAQMSWRGWLGVLFLAYVASLVGYVGWGRLLAHHPASKITPLALLVPVIALFVAWLALGERLNGWHWSGIVVVMSALVVQVFGARWLRA